MTSNNKTITVITNSGLANRFRVLFSYYQYALDNSFNLNVGWSSDMHCNGLFVDYFEPIPNVTFNTYIKKDRVNCVYEGCNPHADYLHPDYSLLKLKPSIQNIVSDKINIIGPDYISIHVRRTDITARSKRLNCFLTDDHFFQFIELKRNRNSS